MTIPGSTHPSTRSPNTGRQAQTQLPGRGPEAAAADRQAGFTLIDPDLFCLGGQSSSINVGRITQHTALGISAASRFASVTGGAALKTVGRVLGPVTATASAALTTTQMHNSLKAQAAREERIADARQTFLEEGPVDWHALIPDLMAGEYHQRVNVADRVGIAGDYIAAGSGFLMMFPPVAIAGFATGLAIKAGGELGKQSERQGISNIYDVTAQAVLNNITFAEINRLWLVLASRGISADASHRLEIWAFCRALAECDDQLPSGLADTRDNLLGWLEEKLLKSLDARRAEPDYDAQIERELGVGLGAGHVTVSWANSAKQSIARIQAPTGNSNVFVTQLKARMLQALASRVEPIRTAEGDGGNTKMLSEAVERAIAATLADFDTASMMAAKIAYRLYVDGTGYNGAIACSDMHGYSDSHFLLDEHSIDLIRCGVFRVTTADEDAQTAFIPYLRRVSIPIGDRVERVKESFELLSSAWYKNADAAARQLPSQGIPAPLVDWYLCDRPYLESQLQLVAEQLEAFNASSESVNDAAQCNSHAGFIQKRRLVQGPKMPLQLGLRAADGDVLAGRHFIKSRDAVGLSADLARAFQHNSLTKIGRLPERSATRDELIVALTRLLNAALLKVDMEISQLNRSGAQGSVAPSFSAAEFESMLSVRQTVLRGIKHWLHALLTDASAADQPTGIEDAVTSQGADHAQTQWTQRCLAALTSTLEQTEAQLLKLIELSVAAA